MRSWVRQQWDAFGITGIPAPLQRYIWTLGLLAVLFDVTVAHTFVTVFDAEVPTVLGLTVALFTAAYLLPSLSLNIGTDRIIYRFTEFPILLAAMFAPWQVVLLVASVFDVAALGRELVTSPSVRWRTPLNHFVWTSNAAVLVAVIHLVPAPLGPFVAALVGVIVSDLLISNAVRLLCGQPISEFVRRGILSRWAMPLSSGMVVSLMSMIQMSPIIVLGVAPLVMSAGFILITRFHGLLHERDHWQKMDRMGHLLTAQFDEDEIVKIALRYAVDMFDATEGRVILTRPDGTAVERGQNASNNVGAWEKTLDVSMLTEAQRGLASHTEQATVVVPLLRGEQPFGSLTIVPQRHTGRIGRRARFVSAFAHTLANHIHIARTTREVSETAAQHAYLATHDSLTDLGNRLMLTQQAPGMLARSAATGRGCVMFVIDLDGFKNVNDTLGHEAGDAMLVEVAARIKSVMRDRSDVGEPSDLMVRLGGDEFAILSIDHANPAANASMLARRLRMSLSEPVTVQGMQMNVDCCIGFSVQGEDGEDIATLMRLADIAMYEAKKVGHGQHRRYTPQMACNAAEDLTLASEMCEALPAGQIECFYQPQVSLSTGRVVGFEALVRWNHPERGLLTPDKFLPMVERTEQIHALGEVVLRQSARVHQQMVAIAGHPLTMSVNMSVRNLLDSTLPETVESVLSEFSIRPEDLVVEITETAPVNDLPGVSAVVDRLVALGVTISLDDFGTGYSTLSSLSAHSKVGEVKIDRGFTLSAKASLTARVTVESIVKIAATRGCRVVGEGIEDAETATLLTDLGVDVAQGYFISRPMDVVAAQAWLEEQYTRVAPTLLRIA